MRKNYINTERIINKLWQYLSKRNQNQELEVDELII